MSFVAVAIGGAAVVGAGASLIGSSKAAKAEKSAANQANQVQEDQLAEAKSEYQQNRTDLQPYREAGYTALGQLTNLTSGDPAAVTKQLTADPGYQFGLDQGTKASQAGAAARGGVLSGAAEKALARYGTDYAGTKLNDSFNRLAAVAGIGQTATNTGIQAGESNLATQQAGTSGIANTLLQAGNARASQYAAGANAVTGAANSFGQYLALKNIANPAAPSASGYGGYTGSGDYGYGDAGAYGIAGSDGVY